MFIFVIYLFSIITTAVGIEPWTALLTSSVHI